MVVGGTPWLLKKKNGLVFSLVFVWLMGSGMYPAELVSRGAYKLAAGLYMKIIQKKDVFFLVFVAGGSW